MPVLNRLLPVMLDTAMSADPMRRAANEVATSGRDVESAINRLPMKLALSPVIKPIFSPAIESPTLARAMSRVEMVYSPIAFLSEGSAWLVSGCGEILSFGSALCKSHNKEPYMTISMDVDIFPASSGT